MCGRYFIDWNASEITRKIQQHLSSLSIFDYAQKEVFPTQKAVVLVYKNGKIESEVMKWGIEGRSLLINARSETLNERVTFRKIKDNRCAIIANGFFEWHNKKKIYITKRNEQIIYLAGFFNEKQEFVILTGESEHEMQAIHARTPLIMNQQEMSAYLKLEAEAKVENKDLHFELYE